LFYNFTYNIFKVNDLKAFILSKKSGFFKKPISIYNFFVIAKAYGKINLTLEILGKSINGYHEIKSVFQRVSIYDEIELRKSYDKEIKFNINIDSSDTTVHKAIKLFFQISMLNEKISVFVKKNIPVGSGLGGGSSDAATTLRLLNVIFGSPLSDNDLFEIAKEIGSDVPFFLNGSTAIVEGRGDVVRPVQSLKVIYFLLVFPEFRVSTKRAYEIFDEFGNFSQGLHTKELISFLEKEYSISELNNRLYNDFGVLFRDKDYRFINLFKEIEHITGQKFHLTGSGSVVFSLFERKSIALEISKKLLRAGYKNIIIETF
jgi:4-diphosphocytidyl-2-C-methyl-D-erythritol kinase